MGASRPKGISRAASVEGITGYHLQNGLQVLLFPDPSKQTANVKVTHMVGSRHEGLGGTGTAHLLELMVFKGAPNRLDIPKAPTSHGCRANGSAWYDRTHHFETFAASEENIDLALDLESDRRANG